MRYADVKLLLRWARLQMEIAVAKVPAEAMNMRPEHITRSAGYQKLRAWYAQLSPRAKADARRWMTAQCDGVKRLLEQAKASGERIDMGDITIEVFDHAGAAIEPIELEAAPSCPAGGGGIPGVERDSVRDYPIVRCPSCSAIWPAHQIEFTIPTHERQDPK